jgi:hypothetical protein
MEPGLIICLIILGIYFLLLVGLTINDMRQPKKDRLELKAIERESGIWADMRA